MRAQLRTSSLPRCRRNVRALGWMGALLLALTPATGAAQALPRPEGVSDSSIAWGKALFHGAAQCAACHGRDAGGTDRGPALTGALWLHGPGTYAWLVEQISLGVPAHETWTGKPMPPRGWTNMPAADVRAVAAYVWAVTHPPRPPAPRAPVPGGGPSGPPSPGAVADDAVNR